MRTQISGGLLVAAVFVTAVTATSEATERARFSVDPPVRFEAFVLDRAGHIASAHNPKAIPGGELSGDLRGSGAKVYSDTAFSTGVFNSRYGDDGSVTRHTD